MTSHPSAPSHTPHFLALLTAHFSADELRDLCFALAIDYDNLAGTTKRAKARELLRFLERRERLHELRAHCTCERPNVPWARAECVPSLLDDDDDTLADALMLLTALPQDAVPDRGSLPLPSRLLLPPNPLFVGRGTEFQQLGTLVKSGGITTITATTGIGGIGKTQLASEFAHRYGRFFAGGVFWLNCERAENIAVEIAACGVALNLPGFEALNLDEQVARVRQAWQHPIPRLLIFDNCEDEAVLTAWRPPTGGCRLLVTSRRTTWDPALDVTPLALAVLPRAEAIALLHKFRPDLAADDPDLDALAAEVGDLPLALHLVGSFLKRYRHETTPAAYLRELRALDLLDHESLQGSEVWVSPTAHGLHVGQTFALSYRRLQADDATDALARALLARAAYFAPGVALPRALLLTTIELPDEVAQRRASCALRRLLDLGLMEAANAETLKLHRLIGQFVRAGRTDTTAQTAVEHALNQEAHRLNEAGYPPRLRVIQPHLQAVTDAAFGHADERAAALCHNLGILLRHLGDLAGARHYLERALVIRERVLGKDHPDTAITLNDLGSLLHTQGNLPEARSSLEHALAIQGRVLGAKHPDLATTLDNLGALYQNIGDFVGARRYFDQALAIYTEVLGEEHKVTAMGLNNLGHLLYKQGDIPGARAYFEQSLAIHKRVLGVDHPATAVVLNNLGYLLRVIGDLAGARPYLEQALTLRAQVLGTAHPDTARSLSNLGLLHQAQGDLGAAHTYFEQALTIRERVLGPEHPDTAITLNNLGVLLHAQGNLVAARSYLDRALAIRERVLGPDHPDTATTLNNLGTLFQALGDRASARSYLDRALTIHERVLGLEHPDTAQSLNSLHALLKAQEAPTQRIPLPNARWWSSSASPVPLIRPPTCAPPIPPILRH